MRDFHPAPAVVVGVDGSPASMGAAVWAADEAAGRDVPLKLVYVIYRADLPGTGVSLGTGDVSTAGATLSETRRTVETAVAGRPVKIETEVRNGNPLTTLIELSQSAVMMCVGSIGIGCACHHAGSTAAALAGSARCPVAVIHCSDAGRFGRRAATTGRIVAEADPTPENNAVLQWAMAEALLRDAPLRLITTPESQSGDIRTQLNRRVDHWAQRYPGVTVESLVVPGGVAAYLADNGDPTELFVSGTRDRRTLGRLGEAVVCSVLTVGEAHP